MSAKKKARLLMLAVAPAAAAFLLPSSAHAATDTWTGAAGGGNWSAANNWSPVATPVTGDILVFATATGSTATLTDDNGAIYSSLIFDGPSDVAGAAAAFTINPGGAVTTLTLTGAITDRSANGNAEIFNLGVSGANVAFSGAGNSNLTFNNGATFTGGLSTTTNGATPDALAIGAGQTVTFGGASTIGVAAGTANSTTSLSVVGSSTSTLTMNANLTIGGNNNTGTGTANNDVVNLSGIGVFNMTTMTGSLNLGTSNQTNATLTLAGVNNNINVATINVGNFTPGSSVTGSGTLHLGAANNTLDATTLNIGAGVNGTMDFAGSTGAVAIQGLNGQTGTAGANITVGVGKGTNTSNLTNVTAALNLAGHTANIDANIVTLGLNNDKNFSGPLTTGTINFDTGVFNAQQLIIGQATQSHGKLTATFTLGTNASSNGTLNVTSGFFLENTGTFITADGNALISNFVMNGGTANIHTPIVVAPGGATSVTTTMSLQGGTLNMFGNAIGANGNNTQSRPVNITTFTMPGSGKSATIMNLGTAGNGVGTADGISGAGLTMNGAGTLILDGTNTYGQTTVSSGVLQIGAGSNTGTLGTGAVTVNGGALKFNRNDNALNISNAIGGTANGTVQQVGTGTTTLSGTNGYLGKTLISGGTLALSTASTNNIASSSNITVNGGGTLDVTQVTGAGGFALAGAQALNNNGAVLGSVAVSTGTIATGTGNYGDVNVTGGLFTPGTATTTGTVGAGNLTVSSGNLKLKFGGSSGDRVNLAGSSTLANSQIKIAQLSTVISGSYTVLTSTSALSGIDPTFDEGFGSGVLGLIGRTTYTIDAAAFSANKDQLVLDVNGAPAALRWTGLDAVNPTSWDNAQTAANWIRTDGGSGDTTHFYDVDTVVFDDNNNNQYTVNISGSVSPTSITFSNTAGDYTINGGTIATGSLLVNGSRAVTLTSANTFSGGTTVQSGTLNAGGAGALGSGPITISGGTLNLTVDGAVGNNPITLSSGNLNLGGTTAPLGNGTLTLTGGTIDNISAGSLTLANNPQTWTNGFTYAGTTQSLNMGTGAVAMTSNNTITVNNNTLTVGGIVSGSGKSLAKAGNGTLLLSGVNTYSGGTVINAGVLNVGNFSALGTGAVGISGGTLDLSALPTANIANGFGARVVTISGTGAGGEGALFNSGLSQTAAFQKITLAGDATIGGAGAVAGNNNQGRYDLRGGTPVLDLQGHTLTKVGSSQFTVVGGSITAGNIIVSALPGQALPSVLGIETSSNVLAATNPDSTVSSITFNDNTALEVFQLTGTVTRQMFFNGNVLLENGNNTAICTIGSPMTLNTGSVLTMNTSLPGTNGPITLTGNITGDGSLVKANNFSTAVLTLSGTNSYTGDTTINGGKIVVTGSLNSSGNVNVNNTGTLAGTGSVGNVLLASGGTISPGVNAGAIANMTLGTLAVNGGNLQMDVGAGTNDELIVAGAANFTASSTISIASAGFPLAQGSYALLSAANLTAGQGGGSGVAPTLVNPTRQTWTLDYSIPNQIMLNVGAANSANLVWTGVGGSVWDLNQTQAWLNSGNPDVFFQGDNVTFDDVNNNGNYNVALNTAVIPASTTFNNSAGNYNVSGAGSIGGSGALTKQGGGTLILANTGGNAYSGGTVIQNGTLQLASAGALPVGTSVTLGDSSNDNGVLDLNGSNVTVGGLAIVGSGTANIIGSSSTTANSTLTYAGGASTFAGTIQDTLPSGGNQKLSLAMTSGSLNLSGPLTYTGTTAISSGATLEFSGASARTLKSIISGAGNIVVGDGSAATSITLDAVNTFTGNITVNGNATLANDATGTIATAKGISINNGGTILFTNATSANNFGSGTTIAVGAGGGTLRYNAANVNGLQNPISIAGGGTITIDTNDGVTGHTYTDSSTIAGGSGSTVIITNSAATLPTSQTFDLSGNNSGFSGTIIVQTPFQSASIGGTRLEVGSANSLGSASVVVTNSNQLWFNAAGTYANAITLVGVGANTDAPPYGAMRGISGITLTGPITLSGDAGISDGTAATNTATLNGKISGPGALSLFSGVFTLNNTTGNPSNYGPTTPGSAATILTTRTTSGTLPATVILGNANSLSSGGLQLQGGTLQLNGVSVNVNNLSTGANNAATSVINNTNATAATLTFGADGSNQTYAGLMVDGTGGGALSIVKVGTGIQTMSGANTYSGGTNVSGGTLVVGHPQALGTGGLAIHTGATVQLQAGLTHAVVLPSVAFDGSTNAWTGALDLTNDKLIVEAAVSKATVLANLQNQAHSVLMSSTMASNYGIAVIDNTALATPFIAFGGQTLDPNSILVSSELLGDANADGTVDTNDLTIVLNNFGQTTGAWTSGNFDGSATIGLTDLADVLNNLGATNTNASAGNPGGVTATPEPTSLAVLGLGAVALLSRRRKA